MLLCCFLAFVFLPRKHLTRVGVCTCLMYTGEFLPNPCLKRTIVEQVVDPVSSILYVGADGHISLRLNICGEDSRLLKRFKTVVNESSDHLVCPITHKLPVDPVIANDGHVYERTAIEQWFKSQPHIRSPMTNEPMGGNLVSSVQTCNLLRSFVENGLITGDLADSWKKKIRDEKDIDTYTKHAESGDEYAEWAMEQLFYIYRNGDKSQKKDVNQAHKWARKAYFHDPFSARALMIYAECYEKGYGVEINSATAFMYYGQAAVRGSQHSSCKLARSFQVGTSCVPRDYKMAEIWYKRGLCGDCTIHCNNFDSWVKRARKFFKSHPDLQMPSFKEPETEEVSEYEFDDEDME